jgi:competence protein ComEA
LKSWWVIAFSVVLTLLAAGTLLLVSRSPRGTAIQLSPPPTPAPLVVHVAGAVATPGVYQLPPGSRVQDAIAAAGGFLPEADRQVLNLAATLKDGQMVRAPLQSESSAAHSTQVESPSGFGAASILNINTATAEELEALPKIGPVLAQRIIDYRQANGPFTSLEELLEVAGIGEEIFAAIKDLVSVDGSP